ECILKTADAEDVDLIVIANKGRGNLARVLFGSAAEKVFRHSKVPVVCVRDPEKFKQGRKP
ncbi:MAG: universal stress protein, partial [Desulfotignum sp.]